MSSQDTNNPAQGRTSNSFRPQRPSRATITGDFKSKFEKKDINESEGEDEYGFEDDNPFADQRQPQSETLEEPKPKQVAVPPLKVEEKKAELESISTASTQ